MYSAKYDLRKTQEYRTWKTVINGGTVKTPKLQKHNHQNIENAEAQSMPFQNPVINLCFGH